MRILFLHINEPAQFRHVARALGADSGNQVVFGTIDKREDIPGVNIVFYKPHREPEKSAHPYARLFEKAVLHGQAVYRMCSDLKKRGFEPDIVYAHSGFGPPMYVSDVFPNAKLMCFFEWYFRSQGQGAGFLPYIPFTEDDVLLVRARNAPILMDLAACDWGVIPTAWQRSQFPAIFQPRLTQLHDGIDTDYYVPAKQEGGGLKLPGLDLSGVDEIVTYATRGMEPTRGFCEFMRGVAELQRRRPKLHVVVAGEDRAAYSPTLPDGQTYKQKMLAELDLDLERLHFTGLLPYGQYKKLLQASSAHVYLTVPFVLSWSLLDAMSCAAPIVASDTPPVRELVEDGKNGLLFDFFDTEALVERVCEAIDQPKRMAKIRRQARQTIIKRYALKDLLPRHLQLIADVAAGKFPSDA